MRADIECIEAVGFFATRGGDDQICSDIVIPQVSVSLGSVSRFNFIFITERIEGCLSDVHSARDAAGFHCIGWATASSARGRLRKEKERKVN